MSNLIQSEHLQSKGIKQKAKENNNKKQTNKDLYLKSNVSNAALARNDNSVANRCSADEDKNVN